MTLRKRFSGRRKSRVVQGRRRLPSSIPSTPSGETSTRNSEGTASEAKQRPRSDPSCSSLALVVGHCEGRRPEAISQLRLLRRRKYDLAGTPSCVSLRGAKPRSNLVIEIASQTKRRACNDLPEERDCFAKRKSEARNDRGKGETTSSQGPLVRRCEGQRPEAIPYSHRVRKEIASQTRQRARNDQPWGRKARPLR